MGRVGGRLAELDAVTFDAYETLVTLADPVPALRHALSARGVERTHDDVRAAFETEARFYSDHAVEGRDDAGLRLLREKCTRVFLDAAGADLDAAEFSPDFQQAIVFEPLPGVERALARLRATGVELAVVSNWDVSLREQLGRVGLGAYFRTVVTSADVGAPKPDPALFALALERLRVDRARVLHVGDSAADAEGAAASGLRFAPVPVAETLAAWI